ncbi:MAG: L-aspartate oxidase [Desulfobacterales bacterium]|nr:L-aspartate oxidase [Desulfobacterales bacterium]
MNINTDFLVIGTGAAGLKFALDVAGQGTVAIVTKKDIMESNTRFAQGGVSSVFDKTDSFENHIADTLASGDGICDKDVVEMIVKRAPDAIKDLTRLGVKFDLKTSDKEKTLDPFDYELGREGGHSHNRIVHVKDLTGRAIEEALAKQVEANKNITVYENHIAIDLITYSMHMKRGFITTNREANCCGAYVLDKNSNQIKTFTSHVTVLATGGTGKVYLYTSNPDVAAGDGIAMGYRAGASVADLEFVQFHPTCLYHPDAKNFLISEAVRGEGGILINADGNPFMEKYSPLKDLACRDVVARAIDTELKQSGNDSVFLDITHKDSSFVKTRFPHLYERCLSFGIDMTTDPIPVVPAAHYMCGGVVTDMCGRTDVKQLYAIGETACTGLHGANRLASNSLLEAVVYGDNAAKQAIEDIKSKNYKDLPKVPPWDEAETTDSDEAIMVTHNWDEIRRCMWNYVGIVRSRKRLDRARRRIENIQNEIREYYWDFKVSADLIELRNLAQVAELIIMCALRRKESRGLHYNIEYPEKDDLRWKKSSVIRRPFL